MSKKFIAAMICVMIFVMLLTVPSCKKENEKKDGLKIVTTIFPIYDFTRNIAGNSADLKILLRAGQDIHSYEPTPQDIISIRDCDIFICIGGESDEWVEDILSGLDKTPTVIRLMDSVPLLDEVEIDGGHDDEESEHEEEYDEHIWTSPKRAMYMVDAIKKAIVDKDSDNSETYLQNAADYTEKLKELDMSIENTVKDGKRNVVIFGDRFPFLYFTEDYGIEAYAALSGCAENTEPSAERVTELINIGRKYSVPVVFCVEMSNGALADTICAQIGADKAVFHSCHNLTDREWDSGEDYISIMNKNITELKKALG